MAKYCGGLSQIIWDTTPRTAKGRVVVGMERDWIGFGVDVSRERNMKNIEYEKAEFSQTCKWNFKGSI